MPPIEPNKILNCFNQFVSDSVQILNKFSSVCDAKLEILSFRLQDVEATLSILEAKVFIVLIRPYFVKPYKIDSSTQAVLMLKRFHNYLTIYHTYVHYYYIKVNLESVSDLY